jgi:ribonucleoside-diphosphate reductase alpha chain
MPITPRKRPAITQGHTRKVKTGCGNLYITVNHDDIGLVEVFGKLGKTGGCASAQLEGLCRMISVSLRCDISLDEIVEHLKGIQCASPVWDGTLEVKSCADAIASVLEKELPSKVAPEPSTP